MKKVILFTLFATMSFLVFSQSIGIGTTSPDPSAALEVSSVTQGMLVPRMTTAQRTMINAPANGLLVFDITTNSFWFRSAGTWLELNDSSSTELHRNGPDMLYMGMTDSVGIGVSNPRNKLDIHTGIPRTGSHPTTRPLYVTGDLGLSSNGIEFRHLNSLQGIGFGYNTIYATGAVADQDLSLKARGSNGNLTFITNNIERMKINTSGLISAGSYSTPSNSYLQLSTPGGNLYKSGIKLRNYDDNVGWTLESDDTQNRFLIKRHPGDLNGIVALSIFQGNGNMGIGTTSTNAPMQFANTELNRKIVLKEEFNNDHQYYGFGVNPSAMRYQSPATNANHVFYAAQNASSSTELFRIGYGFANMGTYASTASDNFLNINTQGSGSHKSGIRLKHGLDAIGWTIESNDTQGRFAIKNHYFDVNGTDALAIDLEDGNIGIGGNPDTNKLKVHGDALVTGTLKVGYEKVVVSGGGIPQGALGTVYCVCPSGTAVIGGGYSQTIGLEIIHNAPVDNDKWVIQGVNHAPAPGSITAFAICARIGN